MFSLFKDFKASCRNSVVGGGRQKDEVARTWSCQADEIVCFSDSLTGARDWVGADFPLDKCVGWLKYGQEMEMRLL